MNICFVNNAFNNVFFLLLLFAESPLLMRHFLSIIRQYPVVPSLIEMRTLSMLFIQIRSSLGRLIASATLTSSPTMEKFNPTVLICIPLMRLIVEFDIKPIWILSLGTFNSLHCILAFFLLSLFTDYCSHFQSFRYWSESLVRKKLYPSKSCRNWSDFKRRRCDNNPTNYMGYDAVASLEGVFFIETKAKKRLFQDVNSNVLKYVFSSFLERSDIAKVLKKFTTKWCWFWVHLR